MTRLLSFVLLLSLSTVAFADTVVPTRTIRTNAIITDIDVAIKPGEIANGFDRVGDVIGQEARTTLYAGRPIRVDEIGPPALVTRNQIVSLKFESAGLVITTEGRSLERGGVGDRVRIMNLSSRATLFGQIQPDGSVEVQK
ncbi:flagellar basal body P-ring formation chaperone FlgA [Roseobacter sinensis]|uniref:Flagella basal body P-ring formation protein FlgA n=1 Tax=Roseobacter sinensis TaxID=2931391 RepID=A0ABT3B8X2_9RHOB|nr:flagellar basal body P-ring formation chaperone FlgA [Roseobacter sp. WL0113]MCV3269889.1 flagellar basal body P-ring formation protein FlgA [Roseobacter sp. WL0113]